MSDMMNLVDCDLWADINTYFPERETFPELRSQIQPPISPEDPDSQEQVDNTTRSLYGQTGDVIEQERSGQNLGHKEYRGLSEEEQKATLSPAHPAKRIRLEPAYTQDDSFLLPQLAAKPPADSPNLNSSSSNNSATVLSNDPTNPVTSSKVNNSEDFVCQVTGCNKSLCSKSNRDRHMKTHDSIQEWQCQVCGKSLSEERWVRRHQRNPRFTECNNAWKAGLLPGSDGYVPPSVDPYSGRPINRSYGSSFVGNRNGEAASLSSSVEQQTYGVPFTAPSAQPRLQLPPTSSFYGRNCLPQEEGLVNARPGYASRTHPTLGHASQSFVTRRPHLGIQRNHPQKSHTSPLYRTNQVHVPSESSATARSHRRYPGRQRSSYSSGTYPSLNIQQEVQNSDTGTNYPGKFRAVSDLHQPPTSGYHAQHGSISQPQICPPLRGYRARTQDQRITGPVYDSIVSSANVSLPLVYDSRSPAISSRLSGFESGLNQLQPSFASLRNNKLNSTSGYEFGSGSRHSEFEPSLPVLTGTGGDFLESSPPPNKLNLGPRGGFSYTIHDRTGSASDGYSLFSRNSAQATGLSEGFTWSFFDAENYNEYGPVI
ncbi:hypothetical protein ONS95_004155 [Cadophora gregata]|uniref:uncharacterized protein n=1 Tax=Cadophora gregata TaxID=51156 RepID=UPI0026DAD249|nr:uncharacterized protein ONS95_004155 [Cadophora gregata]KAK0105625.1 hypothetical protein ONS95_004155 [Cadophora gregata]